jgi:glycosyltransferase involved in cell wall biosynthesis
MPSLMQTDLAYSQSAFLQDGARAGLVSVIMPTRNRADLTIQAASSVLKQSYRMLELIIVDDGSTDGSDKRVEEWIGSVQVADVQVKMLRQDQKGAPAARNLGAASSQGEFIQFMDSDDQLHPAKIALQKAVFDGYPQCDFVWSSHLYHRAAEGQQSFEDYTQVDPVSICQYRPTVDLFSTTGNVWSGLFRRSALHRVGPWNESLRRWQDVEYQVRFTALRPDCAFLPLDLYSMSIHDGPRIHNLYSNVDGVHAGIHTLKEIGVFLKRRRIRTCPPAFRRAMGNFYLGLAETALGANDIALARVCLLRGAAQAQRPGQSLRCLGGLLLSFVGRERLKVALAQRRKFTPPNPLKQK